MAWKPPSTWSISPVVAGNQSESRATAALATGSKLLHKSDRGWVRVGIANEKEARETYSALMEAAPEAEAAKPKRTRKPATSKAKATPEPETEE